MIIDTHAHLDTEDFKADLPEVIRRAHEAGVGKIFLPAVDLKSVDSVLAVCRQFPDTCWPMIGLQPEEVRDDWREVLAAMHRRILLSLRQKAEGTVLPGETVVAIGAVVGLIGGMKVYSKFSSGDPDTSKTAASWFGACIFLIVAATILRSFFL